MTKKSPSRVARDEAKKQQELVALATANTDFVEEELTKNGHYDNNTSFKDLAELHEGLATSIIAMQRELLTELEVPGLKDCLDPNEVSRIKVSLSGLSADFQTFHNDLQNMKGRYASKGAKASNQDDVFLAMSLAEDYGLLTTRMSEVIRPTYVYLSTQIGIARTRLEVIVAAVQKSKDAVDPTVVTDVEAKPV